MIKVFTVGDKKSEDNKNHSFLDWNLPGNGFFPQET